jgi:carboxypeptidase C (cathepsin A)
MKRFACALFLAVLLCGGSALAQQKESPKTRVEKTTPAAPAATPAERPAAGERKAPPPAEERRLPEAAQRPGEDGERPLAAMKFDMTEEPPVVTHHQITVDGKLLKYTATVGRLPIKDAEGRIDAEMFYVAYTLDGADPATRPVTFAFNGGPGSASLWLHMGALGPRRVVLQENGFMPASPYRLMDNPYTPLDATDLVLVDAIGTGFSRPADTEQAKRFWSVKGDIASFGEFIRLYITRNERWSSPLFLLGESYGTTRSAGIAGYLMDRGIAFNGVMLLSTVLNFETLIGTKTNDVPYPLLIPSYAMIAAYHHKLAPDLTADLAKTRAEVEQWASNQYTLALNKGDALSPEERQQIVYQLARYTGLSKEVIEWANLRPDVRTFTHYLLADQKLRVGRLDARYTGPDPNGFMDTPFYDPSGAQTGPPFTSVFNNYVRTELGYKTDTPYWTSAGQSGNFRWEWGSAREGFTDTATPLRQAMVKDAYLKILVMEGYYDLATPFYAADYTMQHLDLPPAFQKNISYAHYESGHMVYLNMPSLEQMHRDVTSFIRANLGAAK